MKHIALTAALLTWPVMAAAYNLSDRLDSAQVSAAVFEVNGRGAHGAREYWCVAATHARRELGASTSDRIYLVRGRAASVTQAGHKSVQFTLDPQAAGIAPIPPALTLGVKTVGDNISVGLGGSFCITTPTGF
ncbi:MAG: hypothetical protein NXH82_11835 [Rhodobacteraceae bacterium]|nr:hypothetical protein [Paracoccaceae bacterium]